MADVQFRLFTAHVSQAYLTSINQPPTPRHYSTPVNTMSELKTLQSELDSLVSQFEQATRSIATQRVIDQVANTLLRSRMENIERQLDKLENLDETMENMIGRILVTRELLRIEMSKIDALVEIMSQLTLATPDSEIDETKNIPVDTTSIHELSVLQSLIGVRNSDEVTRIIMKSNRLDNELFELSLTEIKEGLRQTYIFKDCGNDRWDIITPLVEAVYAKSATQTIKFGDSDLLAKLRGLEKNLEEIKGNVSRVPSDEIFRRQVARFNQKWGQIDP
jgi:hypothetical protein